MDMRLFRSRDARRPNCRGRVSQAVETCIPESRSCFMLRVIIGMLCIADAGGKIVGAVIVPHGDFAFDPSLVQYQNGSLEIHRAAKAAGRYLSALSPDVILLSTPHGVALSDDFAFYTNSYGAGYAMVGGDLQNSSFPQYKVPMNVTLDAQLSNALLAALHGMNVSGLSSFADSEAQAIRWGEVLPLTFLTPGVREAAKIVILSQPLRRYSASAQMVPELLRLGDAAFRVLDAMPERVALLMSSDLAHTHLASGPYGFSDAAAPFDAAVARWAGNPMANATALLDEAAQLEKQAMSCGFTSLVFLHGALAAAGNWSRWSPRVLANFACTYYGMLVSVF